MLHCLCAFDSIAVVPHAVALHAVVSNAVASNAVVLDAVAVIDVRLPVSFNKTINILEGSMPFMFLQHNAKA